MELWREGEELCSTSEGTTWRTLLAAPSLEAAYRGLVEASLGRLDRGDHRGTLRSLGRALLGGPGIEGSPAATGSLTAGAEGPVLRLGYRFRDPSPEAWKVPVEGALVPWLDDASLADAGVCPVQLVAVPPGAASRVQPSPVVRFYGVPNVPSSSSMFTGYESIAPVVATAFREAFERSPHHADHQERPARLRPLEPRVDAIHLLAHGEPGAVHLLGNHDAGARWIPGDGLREWTSDQKVAFAVLTVCHSAEGIGQGLRSEGIEAVVAFRGHLMIDRVPAIAGAIWGGVAAGDDLDEVVWALRRELERGDRDLLEQNAEPALAAPSLVVLHPAAPCAPFDEAHRRGYEDRSAQRRVLGDGTEGREVLDGATWRLDTSCVLDRRPGSVVVADQLRGDLLDLLRAAEKEVAGLAIEAGRRGEEREWRSAAADVSSSHVTDPDDLRPMVLTVEPETAPARIAELWQHQLGRRRLVFRVGRSHADGTRSTAAEGREETVGIATELAKALRAHDPDVVLVEREPNRERERSEGGLADDPAERTLVTTLIEQLEAGATDVHPPRSTTLLAAFATEAERRLRGDARNLAARMVCTNVTGAEQWLAGCASGGRALPEVPVLEWGADAPAAKRCLTAAWLRRGAAPSVVPWLREEEAIEIAQLAGIQNPERGADRRRAVEADAADAGRAAILGAAELLTDWNDLTPSASSAAGAAVLAAGLVPSVKAIQVLSDAGAWGWTDREHRPEGT